MRRKFDAMCRQHEVKEVAGRNLLSSRPYYQNNSSGTVVYSGDTVRFTDTYYYLSTDVDPVHLTAEGVYTLSMDVVSVFDSAGSEIKCGVVLWHTDGSVTENNTVLQSGVHAVCTVSSPKPAKRLEIRPVRKMNNTSTMDIVVKNMKVVVGGPVAPGCTEWPDGLKSGFPSVKLLGKTEQKTCEGKNLFNFVGRTQKSFSDGANTALRAFDGAGFYVGITGNNYFYPNYIEEASVDLEAGTVSLLPKNTGYGVGFDFQLTPNETYTLSAKTSDASGATFWVAFYDTDGAYLSRAETDGVTWNLLTFTVPENATWALVVLRTNWVLSVEFSELLLEAGSTATAYEPYVGGIPAPNPDYPQEVVANNAKVVSRSRNLIDFVGILGEGYTNTLNGVTVTIEDGYAVLRGEHTNSGWSNVLYKSLVAPYPTLPPGTYSIAHGMTVSTNFGNQTGNLVKTEAIIVCGFYIAVNGVKTVDLKVPLTIVCGSEIPTEYTPYHDGGEAVAPELYAIGEYRDEWNSQTGKGVRRIQKLVFDGNEVWNVNATGDYPFFWTAPIPEFNGTWTGFYSHGVYDGVETNRSGARAMAYRYNIARARGPESITTVDAWKAWLAEQAAAGTPVTLYYVLETPVPFQTDPMPLTCPTGYGQIIQVDGDLPDCPLEVHYLAHGGNKA